MSEEKTKLTLHPSDPHEIIHILVTAIRMVKLYPPQQSCLFSIIERRVYCAVSLS